MGHDTLAGIEQRPRMLDRGEQCALPLGEVASVDAQQHALRSATTHDPARLAPAREGERRKQRASRARREAVERREE